MTEPLLKKQLTPSPYMQAILNDLHLPHQNIVVRAGPGAGKTTLLELIVDELNKTGPKSILLLAHNKHAAKALAERIPTAEARTIASLGQTLLKENLPDAEFNPDKYSLIIKETIEGLPELSQTQRSKLYSHVRSSVEISMQNLMSIESTEEDWQRIMTEFEVDTGPWTTTVFEATLSVIITGMSAVEENIISFLDQTYAPFYFGWSLATRYDYILIDEGQDLSRAQAGLTMCAAHDTSKIIVVGDPNQAIYGFSGANIGSMDELKYVLEAQSYPLSVCYRCPETHIMLASTFGDHLEVAPGAKPGTLASVSEQHFLKEVRAGDLVICRTNAPLMSWVFQLLKAGKKAHISGKDTSKRLRDMVKDICKGYNLDTFTTDEFLKVMRRAYSAEIEYLVSKNRQGMDLEEVKDRYLALKIVLEESGATNRVEFLKAISDAFRAGKNKISLATVHKVKGLEAETVWVLEPGLMPHKNATTPQAILAERAIQYVAASRGKDKLFHVHQELNWLWEEAHKKALDSAS